MWVRAAYGSSSSSSSPLPFWRHFWYRSIGSTRTEFFLAFFRKRCLSNSVAVGRCGRGGQEEGDEEDDRHRPTHARSALPWRMSVSGHVWRGRLVREFWNCTSLLAHAARCFTIEILATFWSTTVGSGA